jgi:hypothetical protein
MRTVGADPNEPRFARGCRLVQQGEAFVQDHFFVEWPGGRVSGIRVPDIKL